MTVTNNEQLGQLESEVQGGMAVLRYQQHKDSLLLLHVRVPPEAQGRGIASELSRRAIELARERGLTAVPVCPFIATYIRRHPEYSGIVVEQPNHLD
jgi:predicted GNAT family acetyltransferase